jgi:hypothetical protein
VKIRSVKANNRRKAFEVTAGRRRLSFPFARLEVQPTADDPIAKVFVDQELGLRDLRTSYSPVARERCTSKTFSNTIKIPTTCEISFCTN